jgi:hypothetical protein
MRRESDLRPYFWHENNTTYHEWMERDRQHVRIEEILSLWDNEVSEFVDDGFKTNRQSWHEALCKYATERNLRPNYGK